MESEKVREYIMVIWNLSKKVPKIREITFFTKKIYKKRCNLNGIYWLPQGLSRLEKKNYFNTNCSKISRSKECRKVQKTLILAFEVFLQPLFMALFFPFIALLSFELMMGISTLKGYLNLLCSPSVPTYTMLCIVWI